MFKFLLSLFIVLASCNSTQTTQQVSSNPDPAHNSQNSLDWQGVYVNNTNNNITRVQLSSDLKFEKEAIINESPVNATGSFTWDDTGNKINIENTWYKVGENQLIEEETNHVYTKSTHPLLEKYWKLIELNGRPVTPNEGQREAHIIFKAGTQRFNGSGGCNNIMGSYTLTEPNQITLGQAASTQMACPQMETEQAFLNILSRADNYTLLNDTLSLNKARMAPLARFAAVYLR